VWGIGKCPLVEALLEVGRWRVPVDGRRYAGEGVAGDAVEPQQPSNEGHCWSHQLIKTTRKARPTSRTD
jgi:hypothetical protein